MDIKKGKIGNALESVAPDHVVAEAKDIYDNTAGKYQTEINASKQDKLVSGTNIKTINNQSILGSGNISISGGGGSGTVNGARVGSGSTLSPDSNGIITLPNYTLNATPHIAPTAAEVKSALGTGSGTSKYLREDGTWQTPPRETYASTQTCQDIVSELT